MTSLDKPPRTENSMSMATLLTDLHVHTLMTDDNLNYDLRSVCISNDFQDC